MLTNFQTVAGRVRKLVELEAARASGDFTAMPKKEALSHDANLRSSIGTSVACAGWTGPPDAIS